MVVAVLAAIKVALAFVGEIVVVIVVMVVMVVVAVHLKKYSHQRTIIQNPRESDKEAKLGL